jgi:hypothetical protein
MPHAPAVDGARGERETLRRRLREEGTSFLTLREAVRPELATTLTSDHDRAYKRWTGTLPRRTRGG